MTGKTKQPQEKTSGRLEDKFAHIVSPFQSFMQDQATASVILIFCTFFALFVANSEFATTYNHWLETHFGFVFAEWSLQKSIHHWINDGLMSIFFFILGLEIKREVLAGDLKTRDRAVPVMAAAAGGMLFPALIYTGFNYATVSQHGWGIPMATDTAFAVGILALLRRHIPKSLIAFLAALAIIDDIGAILVIAIVYTKTINMAALIAAAGLLGVLILINVLGIRRPSFYIIIGAVIWYAMLLSGVHATIAGILVAFTVPARPQKDKKWFFDRVKEYLRELESIETQKSDSSPILAEGQEHAVLEGVEDTAKKSTTPLQRWESGLEHPVALFVLPIFALANAGVAINAQTFTRIFNEPLSLGIILALVVGKGLGISLLGWLALKTGQGSLPPGMTGKHLVGIGLLGGVGFTMSLFISGLSFAEIPELNIMAKSSILLASIIAGVTGYLWLRYFTQNNP
ncbi:MAG: Na+/H+ antiporter NhaA [Thioalkalispiraceae bacterium]|jgi:NhaA family Na+:H+ antiporter